MERIAATHTIRDLAIRDLTIRDLAIRDLAERYMASAQAAPGADERAFWSRLADTWMALATASETPEARHEGALQPS